jgi:hypothetical protein
MITVRTLTQVRDRYPTPAERDALGKYGASVRERMLAMMDVQRISRSAAEDCVTRVHQLYPNFQRFHVSAREKGIRDLDIMLSYNAKMMYLEDMELLNDQVLTWIRTLFKSFNFTPKFNRDTFTILRECVRKRVKASTYVLIEPFLNHTIEYMSDIPEPVRPEV